MLLEHQIQAGVVAYFTASRLHRDLRIVRNFYISTDVKTRPYVCAGEHNGESAWYALTSKTYDGLDRLSIAPEWRLCGSEAWRNTPCHVYDITNPFTGPNQAFLLACSEELGLDYTTRPCISQQGIDAIAIKMAEYNVRFPWSIKS